MATAIINENLNEFNLMLSCLRREENPDSDQAIRNLCAQIADWGSFLKILDHHRIESVVYRRLKGITGSGVPDNVLTELRTYSAQQPRKMLSMIAELVRLVTIFDKKNIPVLSLKGPVLALQLYGDIGLRPSKDLDLLVSPENFPAAEEALSAAGYRRVIPDFALTVKQSEYAIKKLHHFNYWHAGSAVCVELHWKLDPYFHPRDVNIDDIWHRAIDVAVAGARVKALSWGDSVIYMCTHGAMHGWFRLRWLYDLALAMVNDRDRDWQALLGHAEQNGVLHLLAQGMTLANRLLGVPVPVPIASLTTRHDSLPRLIDLATWFIMHPEQGVERHFTKAYFLFKFYELSLYRGWRYKVAYFRRYSNMVPNDWKVLSLPDALFPIYYGIRIVNWLFRVISRRFKLDKT